MKKATFIFSLLAVFLSGSSYGQDSNAVRSFSLSMQFRPRAEVRDGNFCPLSKGEKPAALVSSRFRLNMDYAYSDLVKAKISFQNVGLWGQVGQVQSTNENVSGIGLFEGWVDLKIYGGLHAKVGRQIISLDDERLFGALDWAQGGRTHDALSVYYQKQKLDLKTYFAFNQNYETLYGGNLNNPSGNYFNTTGAQPYKYMQTIWAGYRFSQESKGSFLFTNLGFQNVTPSNPAVHKVDNLQTTGLNYDWTADPITVALSGYYQFGKSADAKDVSAYYLAGQANANVSQQLNLGVRAEYQSGNSLNTKNNKEHAFNTLYGTGHKFDGHMDYFPYSDVGLIDYELMLTYKAGKRIALNAAGHAFFAPSKFERNATIYDDNLGQEIDLDLKYAVNSFVSLNLGYSVYFNNKNINALKGVSDAQSLQHWVWLSLDVTPQLFKTKS